MKHIFLYLLALLGFIVQGQVTISGTINIDSTWTKEIYASRIPSMADLYNASNHLVFAASPIDSSGNYQLFIPEVGEAQLLRLHIKKKDAPINSLIKGTANQNFGIIALQLGKDVIYIHPEETIFQNFNVKDSLNSILKSIDSIVKNWEQIDQLTLSYEERIEVRREAAENLLYIADTSKSILPAIYALNASDFGFN
ncbi:MAG: hypothetical protein R3213_04585, partial [Flavobacteriaceae bacterium]|nr:hypothetical protein [Flavobacteriaceae bacterium]